MSVYFQTAASIFMPGFSIIAQKREAALIHSTITGAFREGENPRVTVLSREYEKLSSLYQRHFWGHLAQVVAFIALSTFHPLFMAPALIGFYGMCSSFRGWTHEVIIIDVLES